MSPRLLTWGEGETKELSVVREKLLAVDKVDLVPLTRTSVLSLFNVRKLRVNQDCSSEMELQTRVDEGMFVVRSSWTSPNQGK